MRHWKRLVAAAFLVAVVIAPTAASSQSAPGEPRAGDPGQGTGLDTVAACLNTNGRLLVEMLVDESGSLQQTDKENLRVHALRAAIGSIQSLTRARVNDKPVEVEVQISSFASDFRTETDFVPLTSDSVGSLLDTAQQFETRNQGLQTDYVHALRGANEALTNRAAELTSSGGKVCKALFWFTDGAYDVADSAMNSKDYAPGSSGREVQGIGESLLCESGDGVADQLRQSGVVNVAVALTGSGFDQQALGLLSGIVSGSPACGSFPDASRFGVLLDVKNADQLTSAALSAISGTTGQMHPAIEVCQSQFCDRKASFTIPAGVGSFYLLTSAPAEGVERWLTPPGGQLVKIDPLLSSISVGASIVSPTVISATSLLLDVALDPNRPDTGSWSLTFVDPSGGPAGALATVEVYLLGALRPLLPTDAVFVQGDPSEIAVQVTDASGRPVGGSTAAATKLQVAVTDPVTQTTTRPKVSGPDASGVYRFSHQTPTSSKAAALNVSMALSVVAGNGLALRPVVVERAVTVKVPSSVPIVTTTELALPSIEGASTAHGTINVAGPERGTGKVCLTSWQARTLPKGAGEIALDPSSKCVEVAQGTTVALPVALKSSKSGSGTAEGLVELSLASSDGKEQLARAIPVSFEMRYKPNESVRWFTDVVFTLAGVLLPLAVYWLLLHLIDKFRALERLQRSEVPVLVTPGSVERVGSSASDHFGGFAAPSDRLAFEPSDWLYIGGSPRRKLDLGTVHISVVSRFFGLPSARARASSLPVVSTSSKGGEQTGGGVWRRFVARSNRSAALPFDLTGNWVFVVDSISFDEPVDEPGAMFLPTIPVQLDPDMPPPYQVNGRLVALVDDRYGWIDRATAMANEVTSEIRLILEPLVLQAWKAEYKARTSAKEAANGDGELAAVGALAQPSAQMPWDATPNDQSPQYPFGHPKPPWE